jgi:mannose-6-phosphate isomerase
MSNSDNVLRAGLTDKYIDVAELMKHVEFKPTIPDILKGQGKEHKIFHCPVEEFELHSYDLKEGNRERIHSSTADIILVTEGEIETNEDSSTFKKGDAVLLTAGTVITIKVKSNTRFFRATVPEAAKN